MAADKTQILAEALAQRIDEILLYDINAENYRRAIAVIDKDHQGNDHVSVALRGEHRDRLKELLRTTEIERAKSALILKVIEDQIAEAKGA